ncbi:hypothetical protein [Winogradskyella alexanderae]|uniref:Lipoprotein n=1 Tax=Winogradskyella alexanderae TaxID=2877123 RepID=A0ABS7XSX1_9FLAO|nr:hypothetical protein [Winogradskyella alexanderae]MCA0133113.1 hypothetical protein [Winogradskyella alexanderae]
MKRFLLYTALVSVLMSCSAKKQIEQAISHGNYDLAITEALRKLENNKDKKRKHAFVLMLKDAYAKVLEEDLARIGHLKKDGNPELYKTIYETYADLEARQNAVKRIMPININGRLISFEFNDYSDALIEYRYKTSDHLMNKGLDLLDTELKQNARTAYDLFEYVHRINPNFENVTSLMEEAHATGMNYVHVFIQNETQQIIPQRLEAELKNLNAYDLNQFWTTYHTEANDSLNYDFSMELKLKQIYVSPERLNERLFLRERAVVDGWEYLLDDNGNVAKDSLGNDIKIDRIVTARARFYEVLQTKSAQVTADIVYKDLRQNQIVDSFTLNSGFVFENIFGRYRGDRRALNRDDRNLLRQSQMPFPSDEQMVYDSGEDLKVQLKRFINTRRIASL